MASKGGLGPARSGLRCLQPTRIRSQQCLVRSMATEATAPHATLMKTYNDANLSSASTGDVLDHNTNTSISELSTPPLQIHPLQHKPPPNPFISTAQCTLYSFPRLEPTGFASYPSTHLLLPLRKDLLHRAVIFEGDATRQGTASTKWRGDVHGSGRKVRPQKGTGRARLGDKKSPMLRGGGVAFGPKPRDFSTDLPKKMYDIAWRTALSYRYRNGQLIVVDGPADIEAIHKDSRARYLREMLRWHNMGHPDGRTLIVTKEERQALSSAFEEEKTGREARVLNVDKVDVKNLLELGRIVIERSALDQIFKWHQDDLTSAQKYSPSAHWQKIGGLDLSVAG